MQISNIDTRTDNALASSSASKEVAIVISSYCSENDLDDLDELFDSLKLEFAEDSAAFSFNGLAYLQVHATSDKRMCYLNNMLPLLFSSIEQAQEKVMQLQQSLNINTKAIFHDVAYVDVQKMAQHLKKHPFAFSSGNELVFVPALFDDIESEEDKANSLALCIKRHLTNFYSEISATVNKQNVATITLTLERQLIQLTLDDIKLSDVHDQEAFNNIAFKVAQKLASMAGVYVLMRQIT